jgi:CRP-like cAMP-binding protein
MGLDDDIRALARAPLLSDVGSDGLRLVAFSAETRWLAPGEILFEKGRPAEGGYVVVNGRIVLSAGARHPARIAGPGTLLSGLALFVETDHVVTATAQHAASVLAVPRSLFRRMLQEYPEAAETLRGRLRRRLLDDQSSLRATRRLLDNVEAQVERLRARLKDQDKA